MAYFEKTAAGWRVQIRRKGYKPISKSFTRKSDAVRWAREVESEVDSRTYLEPNRELVKTLFEKYQREVSPHKKGARWELVRIKKFLADLTMMDVEIGDITHKHITQWRDARGKQVSAASVRREMNLLSSVFSYAITEWHVPMAGNPCAKVRRPEKPKARTRRVTDDEIKALWGHFGQTIGTKRSYIPWLFEFAVETGMRVGELCQIRWGDVHEDERWLYVSASKNGDDRTVPLSGRALELLKGLPHDTQRVFPLERGSVDTEFRRATKKLGIEGLHFHDTRHEACTRLSRTFGVLDLAKIVGHRDLKSLMVYYNPTAMELAAKFDLPRSTQ